MAKTKPTPPPSDSTRTPELPWLDPSTTNTRVCSCGAPNWGRLPNCRKCT